MRETETARMPDQAAEMALQTGQDPAARPAAAVEPGEVCPQLGKVQVAILKALRVITLSDESVRDEQLGWVKYGRIPEIVTEFGYCGNTEGAHRSSVSRSVRSLAEEKYVSAAVKNWHRFYGMDTSADEPNSLLSFGAEPWRRFNDERGETPTPKFTYVRLTAPGHKLGRHLLDDDELSD